MQAKERYFDGRYNKRSLYRSSYPTFETSLPDHDKRHNDRRCNPRRRYERLSLSFEVSLPDRGGKAINIIASGV